MTTFTATTTFLPEEITAYANHIWYANTPTDENGNKPSEEVFIQSHIQNLITNMMINEKMGIANVILEEQRRLAYQNAIESTDISVSIS
jgi:hypothetical protein